MSVMLAVNNIVKKQTHALMTLMLMDHIVSTGKIQKYVLAYTGLMTHIQSYALSQTIQTVVRRDQWLVHIITLMIVRRYARILLAVTQVPKEHIVSCGKIPRFVMDYIIPMETSQRLAFILMIQIVQRLTQCIAMTETIRLHHQHMFQLSMPPHLHMLPLPPMLTQLKHMHTPQRDIPSELHGLKETMPL
jgi:hypothetical protein